VQAIFSIFAVSNCGMPKRYFCNLFVQKDLAKECLTLLALTLCNAKKDLAGDISSLQWLQIYPRLHSQLLDFVAKISGCIRWGRSTEINLKYRICYECRKDIKKETRH